MTPLANRSQPEPEAEINVLELLGVIWGGKYWVALIVGLSLLLGAFLVLRTQPVYQAHGLLQLEAKSGALALPDGMQDLLGGGASGNSPGETEMEIMRSRMVMGRMVEDLGLQIQALPLPVPLLGQLPRRLGLPDPGILPRYQWGDETIVLGELELPDAWLGEPLPLIVTGPGTYQITLPDGSRHDGRVRARLALVSAIEAVLDSISRSYIAQNNLTFIEEQLPLSEQAVRKALNAYRQQQQSVDVDDETRYTVNHPTYQVLLQNRTALQCQLQEIEQMGLPVFATVNYSPDAANHRKSKGALPILALTRPDDLVIEALRSLRTSLHFGMLDAQTNTILLTSAAPGAGKSFTAVNLATVAAQAGQKVCLVDADLRKGYLRRYFNREKGTPGLTELLAREKTLDEVLIQGPVPELSVITSGRFPPNPSELLMRAEFETLLSDLNSRFDLIIIDSPPTLAVTDPVVIGRYTGATILVARHLETMLGEVEAVRRTFETAGGKVTGAILNGYKVSEGSKYGGQYQYYNYRYSYKSDL